MTRDVLIALISKDIKELELLTAGFSQMTVFPEPYMQLALNKANELVVNISKLTYVDAEPEAKIVDNCAKTEENVAKTVVEIQPKSEVVEPAFQSNEIVTEIAPVETIISAPVETTKEEITPENIIEETPVAEVEEETIIVTEVETIPATKEETNEDEIAKPTEIILPADLFVETETEDDNVDVAEEDHVEESASNSAADEDEIKEDNVEDVLEEEINEEEIEEAEIEEEEEEENDDAEEIEEIEEVEEEEIEDEENEIPEIQESEIVEEDNIEKVEQKSLVETEEQKAPVSVADSIRTAKSLLESLHSSDDKSFANSMAKQKITDIKSALTIADRFRFQRELFAGNGGKMMQTLTDINDKKSLEDALAYIQKNFSWNEDDSNVKDFMNLVHRRFA